MSRILGTVALVLALAVAVVSLVELNRRNNEEPQVAIPTAIPSAPTTALPPTAAPQRTAVAAETVTPLETPAATSEVETSPTPTPRPPATPTPAPATPAPTVSGATGNTPKTGGGAVPAGLAFLALALAAYGVMRVTERHT